ncbi:MAG: hypothetical protein ABI992_01605 [Chthoniobacterales bacterium]
MITSSNLSVIDSATVIKTDPAITRNGETFYSTIFRDETQDGSRTNWLFGTTSTFDTASGFEGGPDTSSQLNQMAVFKFLTLQLAGNPTIDTSNGGVFNLGLVSIGDLTSGGAGGVLTFAGINTLLLATQNGSITLGANVSFQIERLFIYARGLGSNLTIDSAIDASADLRLYSEGTVQLNGAVNTVNFSSFSGGNFLAGSGLVTAGGIYLTSLSDIAFNAAQFSAGTFTDISVSLNAAGTLNLNPAGGDQTIFSQVGRFDAVADTINIFVPNPIGGQVSPTFTIVFNPAAERTRFEAGLGGIQAADIAFSATNLELISAGDIYVFGVEIPIVNNGRTIAGTISAGGLFDARGDVITSDLTAGSTVNVGGTLFVVNVTAGQTITVGGLLTGFGTATAGGDITANQTAIPTIFSPTGILYVGSGGITPFVEIPGGSDLQHTITVSTIVASSGIDFSGNRFFGTDGRFAGGRLTLNVDNLRFDAEIGLGSANFDGADGFGFDWSPADGKGGDGGIFVVNSNNSIFVGENISATTGLNDPNLVGLGFGGAGGSVTLNAGGALSVNATIQVSSNDADPGSAQAIRRSASGGDITLHSSLTTGSAITLSNTSHLLSYLNGSAPGLGGTIRITSDGGDITADGEIVADRGTVIISNLVGGPGPNGAPPPAPSISLDGSFASIRAETIQIASAGDLNLGLNTSVSLKGVTVSLSALRDINGGFLNLSGDGPIPVTNSSGNVDIRAGSSIRLAGLEVGRRNNGRTTGLNITIDAGSSFSITNFLSLFTDASDLASGGNISLTSGGPMSLGNSANLDTQVSGDAGSGANVFLQSDSGITGGTLAARAFLDGSTLSSGANVTVNAANDVSLADSLGQGSGLDLSVVLANGATIGTGGNINVTIGGSLTADSITARISGLGAITTGGNIAFNITGDLKSTRGDALFVIDSPHITGNGTRVVGNPASILVRAANITLGDGQLSPNLQAYIDDSNGLGLPTGVIGSVLVDSLGSITVPGSLEVLGMVRAVGDINAGTLASTDVFSNTLIAAGAGGIRRFGVGTFSAPIDLLHTLTAPSVMSAGGIDFNGVNANADISMATNGGALTINSSTLTIGPGGIVGAVRLNGGAGSSFPGFSSANGGTFTVNAAGDITVSTDVEATTGYDSRSVSGGSGNGGAVVLNSTTGTVSVNSRIEVSSNDPFPSPTPTPRRHSARGGNITLTSGRSAPAPTPGPRTVAINVGNSSQLLALLDAASTGPGGKITILATGANTDVNVNGRAEATRGTIDIRHQGDGGNVNIGGDANSGNRSIMAADVIKAGAFGANGQLNIGNSTLSADTLIRLYATGSNGELNFVANTVLNSGTRIDLAAHTITIQPSVVVFIGGNGGAAHVYTDNPNYNTGIPGVGNSANGMFTGNGATAPQSFASRPGFDDPAPAPGGAPH